MLKLLLPYVVIFGLVMVMVNSCSFHAKREADLLDNLRIAKDSVKHLRDKQGKLVSRVETMTLTIDDLGKQGAALGLDNDDLKKQVGNLSNLVAYYRGKMVVKQEIKSKAKDTIIYNFTPKCIDCIVDAKNDTVDSVSAKLFEYDNGYLSLRQLYNPVSGWLTTKYQYQTGFELTFYKRHDNLFNPFSKKRLYADFRLKDQNASLTEATAVLVKLPPKMFYERTWFHMLVGFFGGVWLSSRL